MGCLCHARVMSARLLMASSRTAAQFSRGNRGRDLRIRKAGDPSLRLKNGCARDEPCGKGHVVTPRESAPTRCPNHGLGAGCIFEEVEGLERQSRSVRDLTLLPGHAFRPSSPTLHRALPPTASLFPDIAIFDTSREILCQVFPDREESELSQYAKFPPVVAWKA